MFVYSKLSTKTSLTFNSHAFAVLYCGPVWFFFILLALLFAVVPDGWNYACNIAHAIEAGPTYSSVFLALPALARPPYGNPTTRIYGLATAIASFMYWGTDCDSAHSFDVIAVAYFPLFLWEALAVKQIKYKFVFMVSALFTTPILYVYSQRRPFKTPFSTYDSLMVTGPAAAIAIATNLAYMRYLNELHWKKDAATVALAGAAAGLLVLRTNEYIERDTAVKAFGTTAWGHILAGMALYVASVNTDIFMKIPIRPMCR